MQNRCQKCTSLAHPLSCERRPKCSCQSVNVRSMLAKKVVQEKRKKRKKKQIKINLWTQTLSPANAIISLAGAVVFSEVILSANISCCLSSPAIQLCFTAGKHGTVCLLGFVVSGGEALGWGGGLGRGGGGEEKISKFKGEAVLGWLLFR